MNELLIFFIIIISLLLFTNYIVSLSYYEFFGEYKISKVGSVSDLFPKRSKGVKTKLPVERDKIEEVQEIDPDVVRYLYD